MFEMGVAIVASIFILASAMDVVVDRLFPVEVATDEWYGHWERCSNRKSERWHKHAAYWYCGTSEGDSTHRDAMESSTTSRRPEKRATGSRR